MLDIKHFENVEKRTLGTPDKPFNKVLTILDMGLISFKRHEMVRLVRLGY